MIQFDGFLTVFYQANKKLIAFYLACNVALLLFAKIAYGIEISYFYDGDTVKIKDDLYEYKLRITDIDAPERNQDYGLKSRRALMQFCKNAQISVFIYGIDKYQRKLGKLHCNNQDASAFMVNNGHAWFYKRYSMDYSLDVAQQNAQKLKSGLWQSDNAMAPWQWRKQNRQSQNKNE